MYERRPSDATTIEPRHVRLLDVSITPLSACDTVTHILTSLERKESLIIGNLNLHGVYMFHTNEDFAQYCGICDLILVDGAPIAWAARISPALRIGSTDWLDELMPRASGISNSSDRWDTGIIRRCTATLPHHIPRRPLDRNRWLRIPEPARSGGQTRFPERHCPRRNGNAATRAVDPTQSRTPSWQGGRKRWRLFRLLRGHPAVSAAMDGTGGDRMALSLGSQPSAPR